MEILAVAVQKGGTGKTTTAAAIASAAAVKGYKALAIDLDPQGNLSYTLGADLKKGNSYDLLTSSAKAENLIQPISENLFVIPASRNLGTITSGRGSAHRLEKAIEPIRSRFDFIVIDTPPTVGELQYNALQAATGLIIPLEADYFCLQSLYQITDTAAQFRRSNPNLSFTGLILTRHNARSVIARQMQEAICEEAEARGVVYLGSVRPAVAVKEAAATRRTLYEYAPKCKPALDYMDIFEKMINKA